MDRRMLEKVIITTRYSKYANIQYARFADDLVTLIELGGRLRACARSVCCPGWRHLVWRGI